MTKLLPFFALRDDLLPILEELESSGPVRYVRFGVVCSIAPETYPSGSAIPNIGIASSASGVTCESYLVADSNYTLRLRAIANSTPDRSDTGTVTIRGVAVPIVKSAAKQETGTRRRVIDQLHNPDTVVFRPAGLWKPEIVLAGEVSTAPSSAASQLLMRRFRAAFARRFSKIGAFHVGPAAEQLLRSGKRLTISEGAAREFDLSEP